MITEWHITKDEKNTSRALVYSIFPQEVGLNLSRSAFSALYLVFQKKSVANRHDC